MNDCLVGHRQVPPYGVAGGELGEVGVMECHRSGLWNLNEH
ncbi:MAG: hypothetical protein RPV21_15490 [Candidatus Sedimenticola sp. (ex Thyasira tokunagai)]